MRRQVITATVLGLTLATSALPALADNGNFSGHTDTNGPGYDVRADVDYHHTTGGSGSRAGGHHGGRGHSDGGGEAIDGRSRADAEAELAEADRNQDLVIALHQ